MRGQSVTPFLHPTENFEAALAEIAALLPSALFVSLDEEMTGISGDRNNDISLLDSPSERYKKMAVVASKYNIVQLGLCLFHAVGRSVCLPASQPGSPASEGGERRHLRETHSPVCIIHSFAFFFLG